MAMVKSTAKQQQEALKEIAQQQQQSAEVAKVI